MTTTLSELINVGVENQNELRQNYNDLTPEARRVIEQLVGIKKAAVRYLSSARFLYEHLNPQDTLCTFKIRNQIELSEDDEHIYACRHTALPTAFGRDLLVRYETAMAPEELERVALLEQMSVDRGHYNYQQTRRSKAYREWKEAILESGAGSEALVTIGFEGVGTQFHLNGQVSRIQSGESVVADGRLLDPDMGFIDTELFGIADEVLKQKVGGLL